MEKYRLRLSALATMGLAMALGCTDGPEDAGTTTAGASTSGPGTSTSSTGSTGTTQSDTGYTGIPDNVDLTTGSLGTATSGSTGGMNTNGGTQALTAEQIASIKDGECAGVTASAEPVPPVIQLVVDVSLSMDEPAPGQVGMSRWDLARPALLAALDALPDDVAVGLQLFPTSDPPGGRGGGGGPRDPDTTEMTMPEIVECVGAEGQVPIAPLGALGSTQRTELAEAMNQTALYIGTPTHDAYHNALENGLKQYDGPGDKFMLLMTDGAPTQLIGCLGSGTTAVDVAPIVTEVTAAAAENVGTFVIGSPGSEDTSAGDMRPFLSELAQVGGTGAAGCAIGGPAFCHFDMTQSTDFSAALAAGLAAISDQVKSTCVFSAPDTGTSDRDLTSVIVERSDGSAVLVLNDADGDCGEGWMWNAAGEIELCPTTCAAVEADPGASVSVSLGCDELIR